MQTDKIEDFPVVLMGVEYWTPLLEMFRSTLYQQATIDQADIDLVRLTDSPDEAIAHITTRCAVDRAARGKEADAPDANPRRDPPEAIHRPVGRRGEVTIKPLPRSRDVPAQKKGLSFRRERWESSKVVVGSTSLLS